MTPTVSAGRAVVSNPLRSGLKRYRRQFAPLAALMVLAVWRGASLAAVSSDSNRPYTLVPGAIVDPGGCRLYMMTTGGGIDALDIASGKMVWHQAKAAIPLLLDGSRLVTEADSSPRGTLLLVVLDSAGGALLRTLRVPLAPDVTALPTASPSRSFEVRARMENGALALQWHYVELRRAGAYRAQPHIITQASGASLIELQSGKVTSQPLAPSALRNPWMPAGIAGFPPAGGLTTAPRQVGNVLIAVRLSRDGGRVQTTAYRWNALTGAPLATLTWPGTLQWSNFSADGLYFLTGAQRSWHHRGLAVFALTIYSIGTRAAVAEFSAPVARTPFLVCGTIAVYEVPHARWHDENGWHVRTLALRALDLKTRRGLWNRPLRDLNFHYLPPPRPPSTTAAHR